MTRLALGEDGPTHQPIEQLMMLRAMPHLTDLRPADANETAACGRWRWRRKAPSFMALSRQDLPVLDAAKLNVMAGVAKGAYVVEKGGDVPKLLIVATGAELWPALEAAKQLNGEGTRDARDLDAELAAVRAAERGVQGVDLPGSSCRSWRWKRARPLGWWKWVGRAWRRDRPGALWRIGAGHDGAGEAGLQRGRRVCAREEAAGELREETTASSKKGTPEPVGTR